MTKEQAGIGAALIAAVGSIVVALIQNSSLAELKRSSPGSLEDGQKICSIFAPGIWRDSLIVPKSWTRDNCTALGLKMVALEYQVGCAFPNAVEFGSKDVLSGRASDPPRNCGW
jgi:hypothetical protein